MVQVLKVWETPNKDYGETFYTIAGNSILHWRTKYVGDDQEIYELCTTKKQIRALRDFLNGLDLEGD